MPCIVNLVKCLKRFTIELPSIFNALLDTVWWSRNLEVNTRFAASQTAHVDHVRALQWDLAQTPGVVSSTTPSL